MLGPGERGGGGGGGGGRSSATRKRSGCVLADREELRSGKSDGGGWRETSYLGLAGGHAAPQGGWRTPICRLIRRTRSEGTETGVAEGAGRGGGKARWMPFLSVRCGVGSSSERPPETKTARLVGRAVDGGRRESQRLHGQMYRGLAPAFQR